MIHIKGSPKGIVIAINDTDYDSGRQALIEKLLTSKNFFNGTALKVHMTSNVLTEAELFFLRDIVTDILYETQIDFIDSEPKMLPQKHSPFEDLAKNESVTKYIRHSIPCGKKIFYEHSVVIFGDIDAGAKVDANGNIVVLGSIYGAVHAGKNGNRNSFIIANRLNPEKIMIDTLSADIKYNVFHKMLRTKPEIAYVKNHTVYIRQLA